MQGNDHYISSQMQRIYKRGIKHLVDLSNVLHLTTAKIWLIQSFLVLSSFLLELRSFALFEISLLIDFSTEKLAGHRIQASSNEKSFLYTEVKVVQDYEHSSEESSAPTNLRPQVRIPSTTSTLFQFIQFRLYICYLNWNKINKKEAGIGPFLKKYAQAI